MKLVLFLLSACAAVAVASPHNIHAARRHAIAARAPIPAQNNTLPLQRRARCRSSSSYPSSTPAAGPLGGDIPSSTSTLSYPIPSTSTQTPQPTPSQSNNDVPSTVSGIHTGQGTYFGVGLGSCGINSVDSDRVVAVSHILYDSFPGYSGTNPNSNPICGMILTATYQGKTTTATVVDRCVGCQEYDLDFSITSFEDLALQAVGRISGMTWQFN